MYKRTKQALINSTPPLCTCMFKAQFGRAEYSDVAFAITTRIDSAGCFGIIEYQDMNKQTICINSKVDGKQPSLQDRVYSTDGCATAITTGFHPSIAEAQVMTPKRTAFGKQVRKQYESGQLNMSRHNMTQLEPRTDGVSNTLTSVQKDNLVAEPIIYDDYNQRVPKDQDVIGTVRPQFSRAASRNGYKIAEPLRIPQATKQGYIEVPQGAVFDGSYPTSTTRRGRVQDGGEVSPTLTTSGDNINRYEGMQVEQINDKVVETTYRIRKLTPRECFRLMGVEDKDIDTIQSSGVSNSQQYKMAGNSIVVDCLYHLFRKMFTETQSEDRQLTLF